MNRRHSSRQRYLAFVKDYRHRRLDDLAADENRKPSADPPVTDADGRLPKLRRKLPGKSREFLREYLRWLWPYRYAAAALLALALLGAGLQMVEPLFMRYIVDRVLLTPGLDSAERFRRLNLAGILFVAVIIASNLVGAFKDYRQRLLNTRVMLALRQAMFQRLLHIPLPKLWDMKTGGILSRLTGDVDTTTGLLQLAIMSPSVSLIRLAIAVVVLTSLNWRLALAALAIIPGVMVISFIFAKRVRPIYRSVRKDAEVIDGRVGETFSGIRVVRAFRREIHELLEYMRGPAHRIAQGNVRAAPRTRDLDHLEPAARRRQRGHRLVRRLPQPPRRRLHRRHHGVPVVCLSAPQPRVEHRQFLL